MWDLQALILRRFKMRCPLSLAIELRRLELLTESVSPLLENRLDRGWFLLQNSVNASVLPLDSRLASGMVKGN